jgi:GTPase SAR1 family protein
MTPLRLRDLKAHADPNVVILLCANKCDMEAGFDLSKAEELGVQLGGGFFRTSALDGEGVSEVFESLSRSVFDTYTGSGPKVDGIKINLSPEASPKGCC